MKKIFIIGDTHNRIVEPPAGYDVTVHSGDCINAMVPTKFEYQDHINAFRKYDYQVIGNHEDMSFYSQSTMVRNKVTELDDRLQAWLKQLRSEPVREFSVGACRIRLSHYIHTDPVMIAGPPLTQSMENAVVISIAKRGKHDIIIFGHTHDQFARKLYDTWILNPGDGEGGEYAEIIIEDNNDIRIELQRFAN